MKKKTIIISAAGVVLAGAVTAAVLMTGFTSGEPEAAATQVRVAALEKSDLAVSVNATGTVYSAESTNVYSDMNYPVKAVLVSVGDKVKEGDPLAELDLSDLSEEIEQQQASLSSSQNSASFNLSTAQKDLETYMRDLNNGADTSILNAQSGVSSAEISLANAERDITDAELDLRTAEQELADANEERREARDDYHYGDDDGLDDETLDQLQDAYKTAVSNAEKAAVNLEKAKSSLEKIKSNAEKARQDLDKARASLEAAWVASDNTIVDYQDKIQSARLNMNFEEKNLTIQNLEAELANSAILSPVAGTVTEVYATEGASGNGLMFVIQDTDSLKVVANIMEYDVGSVAVGNRVVITTDATGDAEIGGTLSKIAPTSTLTSAGDESSSSTEAEYRSEVAVSSSGSKDGLRIGMNAQLSIITEERKNVFSVLYDAVVKLGDRTVVYAMVPAQTDGEVRGDMPEGSAEGTAGDIPQGMPDMPEGMPERPSRDTAVAMPEGMPQGLTGDVSQESGRDVQPSAEGSPRMPENMPQGEVAMSFVAKAIEVETGLENDLYIEVSGKGLTEGMMIISDATGITDGMAVTPRGATGAAEGATQGFGPGMGFPMGGGMGGRP